MSKNKQLFLVSAFKVDEDNTVVEITDPKWIVETSEDRVKAKALQPYLDKEDENWEVKVILSYKFNNFS